MIVKGHDFPNVTLVGIVPQIFHFTLEILGLLREHFSCFARRAGRAGRDSIPEKW